MYYISFENILDIVQIILSIVTIKLIMELNEENK